MYVINWWLTICKSASDVLKPQWFMLHSDPWVLYNRIPPNRWSLISVSLCGTTCTYFKYICWPLEGTFRGTLKSRLFTFHRIIFRFELQVFWTITVNMVVAKDPILTRTCSRDDTSPDPDHLLCDRLVLIFFILTLMLGDGTFLQNANFLIAQIPEHTQLTVFWWHTTPCRTEKRLLGTVDSERQRCSRWPSRQCTSGRGICKARAI